MSSTDGLSVVDIVGGGGPLGRPARPSCRTVPLPRHRFPCRTKRSRPSWWPPRHPRQQQKSWPRMPTKRRVRAADESPPPHTPAKRPSTPAKPIRLKSQRERECARWWTKTACPALLYPTRRRSKRRRRRSRKKSRSVGPLPPTENEVTPPPLPREDPPSPYLLEQMKVKMSCRARVRRPDRGLARRCSTSARRCSDRRLQQKKKKKAAEKKPEGKKERLPPPRHLSKILREITPPSSPPPDVPDVMPPTPPPEVVATLPPSLPLPTPTQEEEKAMEEEQEEEAVEEKEDASVEPAHNI